MGDPRLRFVGIFGASTCRNWYFRDRQSPPASPEECIFAQTTTCVSSDLTTAISPCQFGGRPVCSECGCMASAGLAAVAKYKVAGLVQVGALFAASKRLGERVARGYTGHGTRETGNAVAGQAR